MSTQDNGQDKAENIATAKDWVKADGDYKTTLRGRATAEMVRSAGWIMDQVAQAFIGTAESVGTKKFRITLVCDPESGEVRWERGDITTEPGEEQLQKPTPDQRVVLDHFGVDLGEYERRIKASGGAFNWAIGDSESIRSVTGDMAGMGADRSQRLIIDYDKDYDFFLVRQEVAVCQRPETADHEKKLVKEAEHSVIVAISEFSQLLQKKIRTANESADIEEMTSWFRILNHATVSLDRLNRILRGTEPGSEEEGQSGRK